MAAFYLSVDVNQNDHDPLSCKNPLHADSCVRFEVFTAVTMKNGVFWDVTPCGSCKNRVSE
jgi:hypothetical protein